MPLWPDRPDLSLVRAIATDHLPALRERHRFDLTSAAQ
jgi:hypothetical protein